MDSERGVLCPKRGRIATGGRALPERADERRNYGPLIIDPMAIFWVRRAGERFFGPDENMGAGGGTQERNEHVPPHSARKTMPYGHARTSLRL